MAGKHPSPRPWAEQASLVLERMNTRHLPSCHPLSPPLDWISTASWLGMTLSRPPSLVLWPYSSGASSGLLLLVHGHVHPRPASPDVPLLVYGHSRPKRDAICASVDISVCSNWKERLPNCLSLIVYKGALDSPERSTSPATSIQSQLEQPAQAISISTQYLCCSVGIGILHRKLALHILSWLPDPPS